MSDEVKVSGYTRKRPMPKPGSGAQFETIAPDQEGIHVKPPPSDGVTSRPQERKGVEIVGGGQRSAFDRPSKGVNIVRRKD